MWVLPVRVARRAKRRAILMRASGPDQPARTHVHVVARRGAPYAGAVAPHGTPVQVQLRDGGYVRGVALGMTALDSAGVRAAHRPGAGCARSPAAGSRTCPRRSP